VTFTPDTLRPRQQSFRGARLHRRFEPALVDALREVGATNDATLAMVLLSALMVLLHRHTDAVDIGIGVPIANRHHPGAEKVVGTLLNTLVLRADLDGDPRFRELLAQVRDNSLAAYEHQDMPFEQLVQALQLQRDPSRAPLFGVMFNMLNTPLGDLEFNGLEWSRFELDRHAAQFDLTLTIDAQHDFSIVFEYATDLYAATTMERLADHYFDLLEAIVASPDARLSALPVVSREEREKLLSWGTGPECSLHRETLAQLLEPVFTQHAHGTAVVCGDEALDYEDLGYQAEAMAKELRARGLGRGATVGICLHRSTRTLVSLLGALRAGAAWVPLDASYPAARLEFMARDAGLDLLITETALAGRIPWPDETTLWFDQLFEQGGATETASWDPALDAQPHDPAYVIYTSSSTGRPKGVVIPQRAVCNFLESMAREPGLSGNDCLLAVTTLSFDIAVLEMLLPLKVGARLVLAERPDLRDGQRLRELAERHAVNVIQATPSTWRMLVDAGWNGGPGMRALVGGESLVPGLAETLRSRCTEVWNMYGPTETTVWSSCWRVDENAARGRISLGAPIGNTRIHILDRYGQLCPMGVPGELCIGGAGLAIGYHERAELDAERFIPDPFSNKAGARLYRTGDRARWLDDGSLQHMGRLDFQVKIRGHRI
jgi:amino acid adenylation domain-containing protein